jgi:predicted anti-sigma-YlaC factor YlaD
MKITCKQAVDYISKKEEGKLSATQRFGLWRHLAICSLCRMFSAQNKIIARAMAAEPESGLTAGEKEAMIKSILKDDI